MTDQHMRLASLRKHHEQGFSLIELVAAMVIATILMAFAVPAMHSYIQNNRVVSQTNGLLADLAYARGQAVATHNYVSICPLATAGGSTCDTSDGSYAQGWMVYTTTALATNFDSTTGTVLRVQAAPTTTTVTASSKGILTYDSQGQLWSPGQNSPTAMSFTVCAQSSGTSTSPIVGTILNVTGSGRAVSTGVQNSICG
ncbi:GspH/FimT family pseudopilin [Dyella sp. C11]|uniref:GspH/FimT family pseudopilin n=1 Tax=Dyella sp. C11 TaxID=2126991 RepID=UPI0018E50749|nr:GspH/FimT family pseudopilin [Dyella sp. C11]